jgi:GDP-L-fucose synthase
MTSADGHARVLISERPSVLDFPGSGATLLAVSSANEPPMELNGRTILVTGGTGFLGRHVTNALEARGATVVAVGRRHYDLRHSEACERVLAETNPDAVVHLAEPGRFLYETAIMGLQLLEACRVFEVSKVVVAGTVCAYPKNSPVPFQEDDLWNGYPEETNAPYGIAKRILLAQAEAYRSQYGMNAVVLLPANLYGRHDNLHLLNGHVIPALVRRMIAARMAGASSVTIWGDGSATRDFLHVRDAARAFALALEGLDAVGPVNVGSGRETSIGDLAKLIALLTGFEGALVFDPSQPNGQPRRALDTSRAKAFGFEAEISLEDGLADTIKWVEALSSDQG